MITVFYYQRGVEPNCIGTNWIHLREEGERMMGKNEQTVAVDWCCSCCLVVSTVLADCPPLVGVLFSFACALSPGNIGCC